MEEINGGRNPYIQYIPDTILNTLSPFSLFPFFPLFSTSPIFIRPRMDTFKKPEKREKGKKRTNPFKFIIYIFHQGLEVGCEGVKGEGIEKVRYRKWLLACLLAGKNQQASKHLFLLLTDCKTTFTTFTTFTVTISILLLLFLLLIIE